MAVGWSPTSGWESYEAWERWYLREWGRIDPPPPQQPSVPLLGVYRVFSAPEGIQTGVEVATVDPAAVAAAEREVRWRAWAYLRRHQERLAVIPCLWCTCGSTSRTVLVVGRPWGTARWPRRPRRRGGRWVNWSRRR